MPCLPPYWLHAKELRSINYFLARFIYLFYFFFCIFFWGGRLLVFMLICWRAANNHVLSSWSKSSWADDMLQVAKNEMWVSEVCFACLTRLYGLFVRTLISLTNAPHTCSSQKYVIAVVMFVSILSSERCTRNKEKNKLIGVVNSCLGMSCSPVSMP